MGDASAGADFSHCVSPACREAVLAAQSTPAPAPGDVDAGVPECGGIEGCVVDVEGNKDRMKEARQKTRSRSGHSPLISAARDGRTSSVRKLLRRAGAARGVDVDYADPNDGSTALIWAAQNGHVEIVRLLLGAYGGAMDVNHARDDKIDANGPTVSDSGARMSDQVDDGATALHAASANGHAECARALLAHGADVNTARADGRTALLWAAAYGHTGVVHVLLAAEDVDVNHFADDGYAPLGLAAFRGHTEIALALLAMDGIDVNFATTNGDKTTAIMMAARRGHIVVVRALLAMPGIEVNLVTSTGYNALLKAIDAGHTEIARVLLGVEGIDTLQASHDGGRANALHIAAQGNHAAIVHDLLAFGRGGPGGEVDSCVVGPRDDINRVLEGEKSTALTMAAFRGNTEIVQALLAVPGIDANLPMHHGGTALYLAAQEGHTAVVRALAAVDGIRPNLATYDNGLTPLLMAAHQARQPPPAPPRPPFATGAPSASSARR